MKRVCTCVLGPCMPTLRVYQVHLLVRAPTCPNHLEGKRASGVVVSPLRWPCVEYTSIHTIESQAVKHQTNKLLDTQCLTQTQATNEATSPLVICSTRGMVKFR